MIRPYLVLLGLISLASADWRTVTYTTDTSYTYTSVASNNSYVYYAACTPKGLVHAMANIGGMVVISRDFPLENECRAAQVAYHNEYLYLAYQVVRECSYGSYVCSDIYFMQASNRDHVWSEPILVSEASRDVAYNYDPRIVRDEKAEKVWVAYKSMAKENPTTIKVTSKTRWDKKFSRLTSVVATTQQSTMIPGGFSMVRVPGDSEAKLLVGWQTKSEGKSYLHNIYHSNSASGLSWSQPKVATNTNLKDHNSPFTFAQHESNVYLVSTRTDGAKRGIWVSHSSNQGTSWSNPKRISRPGNYISVGAVACTVRGKKRLYVLAQNQMLERSPETFWYEDLDTEEVVSLGNPYIEDFDDCLSPSVACDGRFVAVSCKIKDEKGKYSIKFKKYNA
eukprot:TRINITY_DN3984_c0_g2_i2.p1 TRINITY_DN3984_c0_g2~~TRINITY_DN3984_c0_g2_i2.p1  ORF type:complete len:393 (+),score=61.22 TRINITY_DN3984_c0_g2_i2:103-1281(+)